ncbi:MAG TPA: hypothetical protein VLL08_32135 [Kineosporiaceae bacterium]|nr:hypothetical protein [Kineosporiaceae bacterium]
MALMDHRKTWRFDVRATPEECVRAFISALAGKSAVSMRKANWETRVDKDASGAARAIGVYQGRGGLAKGITLLNQRATNVEAVAVGSELTFSVETIDPAAGSTKCAMWLSVRGTALGLTADAGFFRSYMNDVEAQLRSLDHRLAVAKG